MDEQIPQTLQVSQKTKSKFFIKQLVLAVVFILSVLAVASAAYFYFYVQQSPETVIKKMMMTMGEIDSYHYKIGISVDTRSFEASKRDSRRQSDLRQISLANEMYYDSQTPVCYAKKLSDLSPVFLRNIPKDPNTEKEYNYIQENCNEYCVWTELENGGYFYASENGVRKNSFPGCDLNTSFEDSNIYYSMLAAIFSPIFAIKSDNNEDAGNKNGIYIDLEGDVDVSNPKNNLFSSDISYQFNLGSGEDFDFKAGLKMIDNIFYFKIDEISEFDSSEAYLKEFENRWLEIDFGNLTKDLETMFPDEAVYGNNIFEGLENRELTEEQKKEIQKVIQEMEILIFEDELKSETIDGKKTRHFRVRFDMDEFRVLVLRVYEIMDVQEIAGGVLYFGLKEALYEFTSMIESSVVELWIGKKDYLLYKFKINLEIKESRKDKGVPAEIVAEFSNFNEPVNISKPKETVSFAELISASLNEARKKARDARRQSDTRQIALANEMYYDSQNPVCYAKELSDLYLSDFIYRTPEDPLGGAYTYTRIDCSNYCLYTPELESMPGSRAYASESGVGIDSNIPLTDCTP